MDSGRSNSGWWLPFIIQPFATAVLTLPSPTLLHLARMGIHILATIFPGMVTNKHYFPLQAFSQTTVTRLKDLLEAVLSSQTFSSVPTHKQKSVYCCLK